MYSESAILAVSLRQLREKGHSLGNGYIHFVNGCDLDRYLNVLRNDTPDAFAVN